MRNTPPKGPRIGAVAIGRNEGARLIACLDALAAEGLRIVYVDSGSTDDSVAEAEARGADVVHLDTAQGFTAARARNAGLARLCAEEAPEYVQFVDGDCALQPGWIATAEAFLDSHPEHAVACGRRRERAPGASVYNRLCDAEWDTPVGPAKASGGDALMRVSALREVGGFRADLVAGEEPELCVRLRKMGWKIERLDAEMTLHDADIHRFGQWWRRARRGGYAFMRGVELHGAAPERHWVAQTRRAVLWGAALPVAALAGLALTPWSLLLLLAYPAQVLRLLPRFLAEERGRTENPAQPAPVRRAAERALFTVLAKLPEAQGVLERMMEHITQRSRGLIEYK